MFCERLCLYIRGTCELDERIKATRQRRIHIKLNKKKWKNVLVVHVHVKSVLMQITTPMGLPLKQHNRTIRDHDAIATHGVRKNSPSPLMNFFSFAICLSTVKVSAQFAAPELVLNKDSKLDLNSALLCPVYGLNLMRCSPPL